MPLTTDCNGSVAVARERPLMADFCHRDVPVSAVFCLQEAKNDPSRTFATGGAGRKLPSFALTLMAPNVRWLCTQPDKL